METAPFDHFVTFLGCAELSRTAEFYEQRLALPLILDQGSCRIYQVSASGFLGFCSQQTITATGRQVIATFVCDDVDARVALLKERGVVFEKEAAYNSQYRIYHCMFRDPDGYLLEIQRFEDERWLRTVGSP